MTTNDETRRKNLEVAIKRVGTAAKLAELSGTAAAYLSQIKNRTPDSKTGKPKTMGDDVARRIEVALGEKEGWMDTADHQRLHRQSGLVRAVHPDDTREPDVVYVPESRIEFSAGNGRTAHYELVEDEEPATYRLSWFQKYGINPERVRRFRVHGDSMEPAMYARDTILVNTDETNIVDGKTYAIRYGDELRVKKMYRRLDGTIVLRSVNAAYKDEEIPPELAEEHITVIGRVRDRSGTGGL